MNSGRDLRRDIYLPPQVNNMKWELILNGSLKTDQLNGVLSITERLHCIQCAKTNQQRKRSFENESLTPIFPRENCKQLNSFFPENEMIAGKLSIGCFRSNQFCRC